jgi:aspartyl-tRNA(Asn)/glutamyl-tRNA(Gln) amidotransferase subunit C
MAISREEVEHLAELSRINLTPEELSQYQGQLSSVLDYVSQLQAASVKKTAGTVEQKNRWRTDEVKAWPSDENVVALSQGETEAGQVKVKRVL